MFIAIKLFKIYNGFQITRVIFTESSPPKVSRKFKKHLQNHEASLNSEVTRITATTSFPPELPGNKLFDEQFMIFM